MSFIRCNITIEQKRADIIVIITLNRRKLKTKEISYLVEINIRLITPILKNSYQLIWTQNFKIKDLSQVKLKKGKNSHFNFCGKSLEITIS